MHQEFPHFLADSQKDDEKKKEKTRTLTGGSVIPVNIEGVSKKSPGALMKRHNLQARGDTP